MAGITTKALTGRCLGEDELRSLAFCNELDPLMEAAAAVRDSGFGNLISYSRKVFIPLTQLCRDVCHYCTFAKSPSKLGKPFLSVDEALEIARQGAQSGCKEALFTLGEKPELRYRVAREALQCMGFQSTLEYVAHVADRVWQETGLLPHINAGCMNSEEIALLRRYSASMGIMLESASQRLCEKGMPHYGSPDKEPERRLAAIELAGKFRVPFTSGILIGIGETRLERIESMIALRRLHHQYGHLQEIIVQNFRAKPATLMAKSPEPDLNELLWTVALARLTFGQEMSIQAPPNLNAGATGRLVAAGLNDWGGVSPVTPDYVNPEAPWPSLDILESETGLAAKQLVERLTIYPRFASAPEYWLDNAIATSVRRMTDAEGFPRTDSWQTGRGGETPEKLKPRTGLRSSRLTENARLQAKLTKACDGGSLSEQEIISLFAARGEEVALICEVADQLCHSLHGDKVSYIVNRNINYTNICYFKCRFCAFSKGKLSENLRGRPYDLGRDEIKARVADAWKRGAVEVCMQGGIHPDYTGDKYLEICQLVKEAAPDMHIHAFSPLEVWQGARTLGLSVEQFLIRLRDAGLSTLPGTAAEILDDEIREKLCPDKIDTEQWLSIIQEAHRLGIKTTATIMFGHIDHPVNWARHLLRIKHLQRKYQGFSEFVPLPFVADESPLYLRGHSRKGPTYREVLLMHAVSRLVLYPDIKNIQASWVKLGPAGVRDCLNAGVNDLGGTLMDESITRAAGAEHGQEFDPMRMEKLIIDSGKTPWQRNTLYGAVNEERTVSSLLAKESAQISLLNTG